MPADFSPYLVALDEKSSSTKFDNLVNASQTAFNNIGDTTKMAFATGLIFDPAQLKQNAANTGDALVWDGAKFAPAPASGVRLRKTTVKQVVNTAAETDLLDAAFTLPALGVNSLVRFRAACDTFQNGTATTTARYRLKLGATLIFDTGAQTANQNANRFPLAIAAEFQNLGATNSQVAGGQFTGYLGAGGTPHGTWPVGETLTAVGAGGGATDVRWLTTGLAIDTSVSLAFTLTVQWGLADPLIETKLWYATVEII